MVESKDGKMFQKVSNGKSDLDEIVQIKRPLLILAGPGMGKTHALSYKINYLVKVERVPPEFITVISFTNEAAINMRKRISANGNNKVYVEQELQPSTICTMHKLSHRIIKDNYRKVGLSQEFKVLPSPNLREVLASDCAQLIDAKREDAKETLLCRQKGKCEKKDVLKCRICDKYTSLLRKFNYIDHDDQVFLACRLLKENEAILKAEQQKAKYLLVDEYQDINYSQWELIKLLSGGNPNNLFVVGDDYQSIYGFRGGDPKYIRNFSNDYAPNGIVLHLTINYRCPANIFSGAFHMVQKYNGGDISLLGRITFNEKTNAHIKLCTFEHNNLEANFIARRINEIGPSYNTLILVPSTYYAAPIKRELQKKFITFSCDSDVEDTDVYLIYLLLRWLREPTDNLNFRMLIEKVINKGLSDIPARQSDFVGRPDSKAKREESLQRISNLWLEIKDGKTLYTRLKLLKDDVLFKKLCNIVTELRQSHSGEDGPEFISTILDKLHLWQNTSTFTKEIVAIVDEMENLSMSLGECGVRILTMKKAKGLGADYVFIVGVENNILPRKDANEEEKKEESRLLYVSMTRAKKELYILHSKVRDRNITKVATAGRSEFIDAIPKNYIEEL